MANNLYLIKELAEIAGVHRDTMSRRIGKLGLRKKQGSLYGEDIKEIVCYPPQSSGKSLQVSMNVGNYKRFMVIELFLQRDNQITSICYKTNLTHFKVSRIINEYLNTKNIIVESESNYYTNEKINQIMKDYEN